LTSRAVVGARGYCVNYELVLGSTPLDGLDRV